MTPMRWLLLRGLVREQRHWGHFGDLLAEQLPGHQACGLDFPGIGTERERPAPWHLGAYTDDVRRRWLELRQADPEIPWGLLTVSMGGMVGLDWTARYPDDMACHVVINTSGRDLAPFWRRLSWQQFPTILRASLSRDLVARERRILGMVTNVYDDIDGLAAEWARIGRSAPTPRSVLVRQLVAAALFHTPADVRVPTLVLSSARDRLVDPGCSAALAAQLGAEHHIHPSGGHGLAIDAPDWILGHIRRWLEAREAA